MFYVVILFFVSGYVFEEEFPYGLNSSILSWWSHPIPVKYLNMYRGYMDDGESLGIGWWRAQNRFRWGDIQPTSDLFIWDDEDSLVKWAGERGMHILPVFGYTAKWAHNLSIPYKDRQYWSLYPPDPSYWGDYEAYVERDLEEAQKFN